MNYSFGRTTVLGGLCLALIGATTTAARAGDPVVLSATASITTAQAGAPYNYTITLHNTGNTNIGTFWFAWTNVPTDYDFMFTTPTGISGPVGWVAPVSHNGIPGDGYGIEWVNNTGSPIAPGGSALFSFTSNDSPAALAGTNTIHGFTDQVMRSFVYAGAPEVGPGYNFVVTIPAPPGALALAGAGMALLARRRRA